MGLDPERMIYPLVGIGHREPRQVLEMRVQFVVGAVKKYHFADILIELSGAPPETVQVKMANRTAREPAKLQVERPIVVLGADYPARDRCKRLNRRLVAHPELDCVNHWRSPRPA